MLTIFEVLLVAISKDLFQLGLLINDSSLKFWKTIQYNAKKKKNAF